MALVPRPRGLGGIVSAEGHLVEPLEGLPEGALVNGGVLVDLGAGYRCPSLPVWPALANGRTGLTVGYEQCQAAWQPEARRAWQRQAGVAAEVLYPTFAMVAAREAQGVHQVDQALARYNQWAQGTFRPPHFWPLWLACPGHGDFAEEVEMANRVGAVGIVVAGGATDLVASRGEMLDGLGVAAERGLVVHWHRYYQPTMVDEPLRLAMGSTQQAVKLLNELIVGGVLDLLPALRVVLAKFDVAWVPHYIERLEHHRVKFGKWMGNDGPRRPVAEYFKQQLAFTVDRMADGASGFHPEVTKLKGLDFPTSDAHSREEWGPLTMTPAEERWWNGAAERWYPQIRRALLETP